MQLSSRVLSDPAQVLQCDGHGFLVFGLWRLRVVGYHEVEGEVFMCVSLAHTGRIYTPKD